VKATRNLKSTREARVRAKVEAEVRAKNGGQSTASRAPDPGTRSTRRVKVEDEAGHVADRRKNRLKKNLLVVTGNVVAPREEAKEVDPVVFIGDTAQVVQITGSQEVTMLRYPQRREIRGLFSVCNFTPDSELEILRNSSLKLARCEMLELFLTETVDVVRELLT